MQTFGEYAKTKYGKKVYRLALDCGCTCPNRDGTKGTGGCIFCSEGGSGDFAEKIGNASDVPAALERAKARVASKIKGETLYVPYFQSFTNTYGDLDRLYSIFAAAAGGKDVLAISIGTRPDCLGPDVLTMLCKLQKIKPVWIELGLQTIHEETARKCNLCYTSQDFKESYVNLKNLGFEVIVHLILGLPGEALPMMEESVRYVAGLNPAPDGVKLSMLHVLKGTRLGELYEAGELSIHHFELEEYAEFVTKMAEIFPRETIIHRLTGDAPKKLLLYPEWSADKKRVLNAINFPHRCE